jgi:pimeloyl-ACP methyl ester carboxylesterase
MPSLVIWGERDRLVAPDLAPYVAAAIPDARLLVLPDIGHTAMMEAPETTARAMLALTEGVGALRS